VLERGAAPRTLLPVQVLVHDGEQSKGGGDASEARAIFYAGGPGGTLNAGRAEPPLRRPRPARPRWRRAGEGASARSRRCPQDPGVRPSPFGRLTDSGTVRNHASPLAFAELAIRRPANSQDATPSALGLSEAGLRCWHAVC
jgi:hypothetical protein